MNTYPSRRRFIKTAAVSLLGTTMSAELGQAAPAASQLYPGPIIDTHTHFYDPTRAQGVPWPPQEDKLLYRTVMPADYRALPKPRPVTGTVVVEASPWVEDNQWILDLAERERFIVGFIGNLTAGSNQFRAHLQRFAANPLFRGIRIGADPLRRGLGEARFLEDVKLLASRDLALDLLGGPDMLPDVSRLAAAFPGLRLIIDHVANIRIDGKPVNPAWREGMRSAAKHPHVYCKVSGLVEGTGRTDGQAPSQLDFYRPVLDVIWNAFGPDRLVYGSNWPVSERFAPCATVQQIVSDFAHEHDRGTAEKLFFKNSKAFYKWVDRA